MPKEIERKFLLKDDTWKDFVKEHNIKGIQLKQAYISRSDWGVVRLRVADDKAYLTLKTKTVSISRDEFEYEIPYKHALELLATLDSSTFIEKTRYKIDYKGHQWDLDVFLGRNEGLVIAEIELQHEAELFERPAWLGEEVSKISRYFNSRLAENPYKKMEK